MPFTTIIQSVSSSVQRSARMAELQYEAKMDDIKRELAVAQLVRKTRYAEKLVNARTAHAHWFNSLTDQGKAEYQTAVNDIEAIVNPTAPKE